jgi:hypothetical protein
VAAIREVRIAHDERLERRKCMAKKKDATQDDNIIAWAAILIPIVIFLIFAHMASIG